MGYSTKCVILDDLLLINYTNIKINIEDIKTKLSKTLNLNTNFIKLNYVKKIINNKALH